MRKELDFTAFWLEYMKKKPDDWREQHKQFLNAQYLAHRDWYNRIVCEPNGVEILKNLTGTKNKKIIALWEKDAQSCGIE